MKKDSKLLYFLITIILLLLMSCSVEKNRKLLNVFFDGVPQQKFENQNKLKKEVVKNNVTRRNFNQVLSIHPDYKSKNCSKCHTRNISNFLKTDRKKICFTCHKQEKFDGPYIHGPVAVRACNTCHDPHKSVNRKLLVEDGKKLCVLCHRIPITGDSLPCKGDNCLDCHEPHMSSNKYFLKKDINTNGKKSGQVDHFKNTSPSQNEDN